MCRSPTYNLAKWLTKVLNLIRSQFFEYSLKGLFGLIKYLMDINAKTKAMCSFDVNALFTNVPLSILYDYMLLNTLQLTFSVKSLKDLLLLFADNVKST